MSDQNGTQNNPFIMELMNNLEIINNKKKYLSDNLTELSETDWIQVHEEITNLIINFNKKVKKSLKIRRKRQNKILNKQRLIDTNKSNQLSLISKVIHQPNNSNTTNRTVFKDVASNYLKTLNSLKRFHSLHGYKADDHIMERIDTTSVIWSNALLEYNNKEENLRTNKNHQNVLAKSWDEALFGTHPHKSNTESDRSTFINSRHCWDTCLNSTGSEIPLFWVLPNEHPTKEWSKYLN